MTRIATRFAAFSVATSSATRAGFLGLAGVVTLSLLTGVGQIADRQVDDAVMAQATHTAPVVASAEVPLQTIVITGKRA